MLQKLLSNDFSTFLTAQNGLEGINKVAECIANNINIDLILMDYEMPIMNGLESIKEIRNNLNYKGLMVGLTGMILKLLQLLS
jgi:CheY-like chemotaxis protein